MILTYHELEPHSASRPYSVLCSMFRRHLETLQTLRQTGVPLPEITFDDGHASQYEYGAPALEEAGFHGIFFITAGWTGQRAGYMSAADLRSLARAGHEIGSHGWSHALLTRCSESELAEELRRSRAFLEDCLGQAVTSISMPGGRWNDRVLAACAEAGYRRVYNSEPHRRPGPRCGVELAGRWMVRRTTDTGGLMRVVRAGGARRLLLRAQHEVKSVVRRLAGDALYQRMWQTLGSRPEGR
ncbi:MAG TPA: polysaccharide deacetylase family protein [Bryobacteraceae bacterium]|nr:polysaccharide deacetylase family protein [Bryobacteraceae bacterium]HOQ44531.1 polysaccharide deacetylase family protein [Bryobacteraceae bacterium]HPQ13607.1 polysaccharide deacetylase family protein [Bryobacteraceae bacterium]HPU70850.1 polysaccharide deacetylase family protein [Bryobacteraceae bacterium]